MERAKDTWQAMQRFAEQGLSGMLHEASYGRVLECWWEWYGGRETLFVNVARSFRPRRVDRLAVEVTGLDRWQVAKAAMEAVEQALGDREPGQAEGGETRGAA